MTEKTFNPFREAVKYLRTQHSRSPMAVNTHICIAMNAVRRNADLHESRIIAERAKRHVQRSLRGHYTLDNWLLSRVPQVSKLSDAEFDKRIQAHRKAWLLKMAGEYDRGELKL